MIIISNELFISFYLARMNVRKIQPGSINICRGGITGLHSVHLKSFSLHFILFEKIHPFDAHFISCEGEMRWNEFQMNWYKYQMNRVAQS